MQIVIEKIVSRQFLSQSLVSHLNKDVSKHGEFAGAMNLFHIGEKGKRSRTRGIPHGGLGWIDMAFPYPFPQGMGVVNDHARLQGVLAERLAGTDLLEELGCEHLLEAFLLDIVHSEVSENAGLNVPVGVNVEILPARGETSIDARTVVPKVADEQGFCVPNPPQPPSHRIPLLWGKHQGYVGFFPDGDVLEVPDEEDPFFNEHIHELIAGYGIHILPGLGNR